MGPWEMLFTRIFLVISETDLNSEEPLTPAYLSDLVQKFQLIELALHTMWYKVNWIFDFKT